MIALDHHKAARVGVAAVLAAAALAVAPLGHDVSFAHPSAVAAASGPVVRYGTYLGGSFSDMATAVAVDRFGNVYVTGSTMSPNFILRHAFQSRCGGCADGAYSGSGDAFVAKFSNKGTLIYSTYLGGRNDDAGTAITVDRSGNAFVVGTTSSPDFPTDHAIQRDNNGGTDAFLTELDPQGGVVFSTYLGGSDDDEAHAVTTDGHGRIYVAGSTMSTDFPVKGGVQATLKGHTNAWIAEFTRDGAALATARTSVVRATTRPTASRLTALGTPTPSARQHRTTSRSSARSSLRPTAVEVALSSPNSTRPAPPSRIAHRDC